MKTIYAAVLALTLSCVALLSATKIADPDTMQYLASGRATVERGLESGCLFSYASDTCQIVYPQWLFQVATYGVYRVGGWNALVAAQIAMAVGVFGVIVAFQRRKSCHPLVTSSIALLAAMVARERFMFRADLFALLPAVLLYYALERYWDDARSPAARRKLLVALAAIQVVWANTHGSFPLAFVILAAFVAESAYTRKPGVRPVAEAAAAIVVASFLNPFGLSSFVQPFRFLLGGQSTAPQLEFVSPFAPADLTHLTVVAYKVLIVVLALLVVSAFRALKIRDVLVLAAVTYLSVRSMRHLALFGVFCAALLPPYAEHLRASLRGRLGRVGVAVSVGVSVLLVLAISGIAHAAVADKLYRYDAISRRTGFGLSDLVYPDAAAEFIERNALPGEMFNDYSIGTYLNWRLFPARKTFIDGHTYTPESLAYYRRVMDGALPYRQVVDRFGINVFILNHKSSEARGLIAKLYHDEQWAMVYFDELAVLFLKRGPGNAALIARYAVDPAASEQAGPAPLANIREPRDFYLGRTDRGLALSVLGIGAAALVELEEAARENPESFVTLTALALQRAQQGDEPHALAACEQAVSARPGYAPARYWLGLLNLRAKRTSEGIAQLEAALRINPKMPLAHFNLGAAFENAGDKRQALEHYRKELAINPSCQPAKAGARRLG